MSHVFISYVRENQEDIQRLYDGLTKHGVKVWLDRYDIAPGTRWKQTIRRAIGQGAFFIACFSKEYNAREKTYMNEELTLAIEVLRQRPADQAWFIPVKLSECEIPDRDIGGGETLQDLQYVELYKDWDSGIQRILNVIQPDVPAPDNIDADIQKQIDLIESSREPHNGKLPSERRVVITGLGVIAPNGIGKEEFWQALISGKSGIDKITSFDASNLPTQFAGEVRNFDPMLYLDHRQARRMSRVAQFAVATAKMSIEDSGLEISDENRHEIGVCFGTTIGTAEIFERDHALYLKKGMMSISPLTALQISPHSLTSYISVEFGISGMLATMSGLTGLDTIIWGYSQIRDGRMKAIIAGSAETPLFPFLFSTLCASGNLSNRNDDPKGASRPYDLRRDGLVISEGGSAVLLEDLKSALDREAKIYAEISGFISKEKGRDMMRYDTSGEVLAQVIKEAIAMAELDASEIDYICADGNSMPDFDIDETNAFKRVFGKGAYNIPVSSIKSMTGQLLTAAGGLQVVASCLALQNGIIPPTINYEIPDPNCDLDYVPNQARMAEVQNVLVNAHNMGTFSVLILSRFHRYVERFVSTDNHSIR